MTKNATNNPIPSKVNWPQAEAQGQFESERKQLNTNVKPAADALIDISAVLDGKMEKWSDVPKRPYNLSNTECVGFINKGTAETGLNLIVDAQQAPSDKNEATLRVWAIESKQDVDQIERFNNIQLDFVMDKNEAAALTKKGSSVTRDDMRAALHGRNTQLTRIIVSNQAGFDKVSQRSFGERYDLTIGEMDGKDSIVDEIISSLNKVLSTLKESAAIEKKLLVS